MASSFVACGLAAAALVGCTSDSDPEPRTVTPTGAYTAIVRWEIERTDPVVDEDGNVEVPVIYLADGAGGTVDVRVQADVVSNIDDAAVIRFADDARDARDDGFDHEPIKDDGVMLLLDDFEPDQARVDARIERYVSIDDEDTWIVELAASGDDVTVESADRAPD